MQSKLGASGYFGVGGDSEARDALIRDEHERPMTDQARRWPMQTEIAALHRRYRRGSASFRTNLAAQDATRAWMSNNDLLAITRLASPHSVNNCPWFLASP